MALWTLTGVAFGRYDHCPRMRHISIDTIRAAAGRIYGVAARTPLIRLDPIDRSAPEIFLKLEVFQPIGSFKIRGAMNAVAKLPAAALAEGGWTVSCRR